MQLDKKLESDSTFIMDLSLCELRLHHNGAFPWVMLIPKRENVSEIIDLSEEDRALLRNETDLVSIALQEIFKPKKLNVANLGNVVSMLHVHVIARFEEDKAWPGPVWNSGVNHEYSPHDLRDNIDLIRNKIEILLKKNKSPSFWLLIDFDNTLMETEGLALPSLINRFNDLYKPEQPLTLAFYKEHFHGLSRESLCNKMQEIYGFEVSVSLLYQNRELGLMQLMQREKVKLAPNVVEALTSLKERGIIVNDVHYNIHFAVVTNNPISRAMNALHFSECGQGRALYQLIGPNWFEAGETPKPKPDVYINAMNALDINPSQCIAIEDSPTGVSSAVGAGITTLGYTGISLRDDLDVTASFSDWQECPKLLESLIKEKFDHEWSGVYGDEKSSGIVVRWNGFSNRFSHG